AGQSMLIYGQLNGPNSANRLIVLYHRINPAAQFTVIGATRTTAQGFYEFTRSEGVVVSNRNWFVVGPRGSRSRVIHEYVSPVLTLSTPSATATATPTPTAAATTPTTTATTPTPTTTATTAPAPTTATNVSFTGTVFPAHVNERVLLQEQTGSSGNGWHTIASGVTNSASAFTIVNRFRSAGSYTLRAYFPGDVRNIAGASPDITLTIQQQQNPSFTINGSAPVINDGQPVTISGTLFAAGSSTKPQPNAPVTLYGRQLASGHLKAIASGTTDANGNYSFTQVPLRNMIYRVDTASGKPKMQTAALYVGVQDVVTAALSAPSITLGSPVTVSGTVTPEHSGHLIYLQVQNSSGEWATVAVSAVTPASTYSFTYRPGQTGTLALRVQITGGPYNVGSTSAPLALSVTGLAPVSSLPAAPAS
ncbi:MAG: hypothetical protein FWD04_10175, partial [Conexibacteraceae bacterium]|nr:hypothetical protein [Conexibacteraceae bacterium]